MLVPMAKIEILGPKSLFLDVVQVAICLAVACRTAHIGRQHGEAAMGEILD